MSDDPYNMRQIIVMRKDLKMPLGKCVAQGAHASMAQVLKNLGDPNVKEWLAGPFTKIAVWADSDDELSTLIVAAKNAGLLCSEIIDAGLTVFKGIPTRTCIAIGPASREVLAPITGHLKLA